jgi:hypothetical protein
MYINELGNGRKDGLQLPSGESCDRYRSDALASTLLVAHYRASGFVLWHKAEMRSTATWRPVTGVLRTRALIVAAPNIRVTAGKCAGAAQPADLTFLQSHSV